MPEIKAGTGRSVITPKVGSLLVGYFNRPDGSKGVHDELNARALVLDNGETVVALCSIELLWIWGTMTRDIRAKVAERCPIAPENILLACTHTHAGAAPHNADDWATPLIDLIADAIVQAYENRQSARVGFGFGLLYGYSINRRWLNRPMDPSVGVMRVDTPDGKPLAIVSNFACHAVVMGYDNYYISGDWAGYSSRRLEAEIGGMALFMQGGAGDVNPLTETVRQRLAAGQPVGTIGDLTGFYGGFDKEDPSNWNIEDRGGGTFLECETLALGYNAEVVKIWRTIQTAADLPIRRETLTVNGALDADEPPAEGLPPEYRPYMPDIQEGYIPLEIMLVRLGQAVFMSQPGEVFSETSVDFRKRAQQMGYGFPWLVSYANGSYAYLPPDNAFNEGGYEVAWARRVGLSRHLQDRITDAILPVMAKMLV